MSITSSFGLAVTDSKYIPHNACMTHAAQQVYMLVYLYTLVYFWGLFDLGEVPTKLIDKTTKHSKKEKNSLRADSNKVDYPQLRPEQVRGT